MRGVLCGMRSYSVADDDGDDEKDADLRWSKPSPR